MSQNTVLSQTVKNVKTIIRLWKVQKQVADWIEPLGPRRWKWPTQEVLGGQVAGDISMGPLYLGAQR